MNIIYIKNMDTGSLPSMLAFGEHQGSGSVRKKNLWYSIPTLVLGWMNMAHGDQSKH